MTKSMFTAVNAKDLSWEERFNDKAGGAILRKELFSDPETGMLVRLVRYPAGIINPRHTHPCGHGMYVLEGQLVTHKGTYGPGSFVWFPEGEIMERGASAEGDVTVVFITNKSFRTPLRPLKKSCPAGIGFLLHLHKCPWCIFANFPSFS